MIKILASYNERVSEVVLENAPGNAKYPSPMIQKEILHILSSNIRNVIREEISDAKFCIIVDEARDESKREQMALVLRFVDKDGFLREQFFDIVHVSDTMALTLKKSICAILSRHSLSIQNIRDDSTYSQRGDADAAYDTMTSFEFIFILHLMQEIMGITDNLCQALQSQSQDILNVLELVSTTKVLIQELREDGWDPLLEKIHLRYQLQHYERDIPQHPELRNMLTISKLCQGLVKKGKSIIYPLVDRLIRLVLTLPVSTATTERAFSAMKIVKTRLHNKMEDEFLADTLVVNIEKEIAEKFTTESIIEDFYSMKERRAQLQ
ncbi:hypothetical protein HHK36_019945 [Tetracentron sinense]|uniref:Zinc finger MYM-type protein 1-like n=1 Tax=Tetracentron sinense TaxID=13715 RepID=A0A834YSP8_TETSI|nr:hypothetical protein HHK36_019945 [Tetracentron sinense]